MLSLSPLKNLFDDFELGGFLKSFLESELASVSSSRAGFRFLKRSFLLLPLDRGESSFFGEIRLARELESWKCEICAFRLYVVSDFKSAEV